MAKEVIAIAQTAEEAEFIQLLLATGGVVSTLHESLKPGTYKFRRGDIHLIEFGEILIDKRDMAQAREILSEYNQRLDKMRGRGEH